MAVYRFTGCDAPLKLAPVAAAVAAVNAVLRLDAVLGFGAVLGSVFVSIAAAANADAASSWALDLPQTKVNTALNNTVLNNGASSRAAQAARQPPNNAKYLIENSASPKVSAAASKTNNTPLPITPALVALRINGVERSVDVIYRRGDDYVIEFKELNSILGLEPQERSEVWAFSTPIGNAALPKTDVHSAANGVFVGVAALEVLGIRGGYKPSDLALDLYVPWDVQKGALQAAKPTESAERKPDYEPSPVGLNELSVRLGYRHTPARNSTPFGRQDSTQSMNVDVGVSGTALGGVWGLRAQGRGSQSGSNAHGVGGGSGLFDDIDSELTNAYWARATEHTGVRLGVAQASFDVAPFSRSDYTGATVAYSSAGIARHLDSFDSFAQQLLRASGEDFRHLRGTGPAGGVAELRVGGRTVARVRIGLDKHYEFLNLNANWFDHRRQTAQSRIEIALFEHALASQPMSVEQVVFGRRRANVATDELLLELGAGQVGNAFLSDSASGEAALASVYAEYGVSNSLALRAGASYVHDTKDDNDKNTALYSSNGIAGMLGANVSLSANTNLDVSHQQDDHNSQSQVQLSYEAARLQASYHIQRRTSKSARLVNDADLDDALFGGNGAGNGASSEANNGAVDNVTNGAINASAGNQVAQQDAFSGTIKGIASKETIQQVTSVQYHVNTNTSLSVSAFQDDADNLPTEHYFTAALHTAPSEQVSASLYRNRDNDYSYRIGWRPNTAHSASLYGDFTQDGAQHSLAWQYRMSARDQIGATISYADQNQNSALDNWYKHAFWQHYFSDHNQLMLGVSSQDDSVGYLGEWQYYPSAGVRLSVGYRGNYLDNLLLTGSGSSSINRDALGTSLFYAQLSLDARLLPRKGLVLDRYQYERNGTLAVNVRTQNPSDVVPDVLSFRLDGKLLNANKVADDFYIINGIKPDIYTLSMDEKNLPFEYSTAELPSPVVRVASAGVTSVLFELTKAYGVLGKLAGANAGVPISVWRLADVATGSKPNQHAPVLIGRSQAYGYFQLVGLPKGDYVLRAEGFDDKPVTISDEDVFNVVLEPKR